MSTPEPLRKRWKPSKADNQDDDTDDNTADLPLPTYSNVNELTASISEHRDIVLSWLANAKQPEKKIKLRKAINHMCDAYNTITNAYLTLLATAGQSIKLDNVSENIVKASNTLCNLASEHAKNVTVRSFADVTAQNIQQASTAPVPQSKKVSLNKGNPFVFERVERVVIGPSQQAKDKYSDSKQTKAALQAAIDPAVLKMRVLSAISSVTSRNHARTSRAAVSVQALTKLICVHRRIALTELPLNALTASRLNSLILTMQPTRRLRAPLPTWHN